MTIYSDLDPRNSLQPHLPRVLNRNVYYKGQPIIEQGADGNRAFYIEKGAVEIVVREGQHEIRVGLLGPGEIFGEMALIGHEQRSATARAMEETTLTVISGHDLEDRVNQITDKAVVALIKQFIRRLRTANDGQMKHYRNLVDFQDRIAGFVEMTAHGIEKSSQAQFREEVGPVLDQLDEILKKYGPKK